MNEAGHAKLAESYAYCRKVAREEAKNFYYAFRVLPQHKSDAMCAVYAFMRKADDLSDDESMTLDERRAAMAAWTGQWKAASHSGESNDPLFVALLDTQRRFDIPDELLDQLIAGTTLDLNPRPEGTELLQVDGQSVQVYQSFPALERYCYLVASVVGLVCIRIFGYTDRKAEQLAVDTGIAFQLTNILRDVKEDAERGRVYLPEDKRSEYNVSVERLFALCKGAQPHRNELELVMGLQGTAQRLYRRSEQLIPLLDKDSRAAMRVLVKIYRMLLDYIADNPEAIFHRRVSISDARKIRALGLGLVQALGARVFG